MRMNRINSKSEKGQIMIIFAVVLVVLLGFTALAVDGGMVFSDRRFAQDAADAAAMAGGGKAAQQMATVSAYIGTNLTCPTPAALKSAIITAAVASATSNHFTIAEANLDTANMGVQVNCISTSEKYLDIRIKITTETKASFAQLFFGGKLKNTVEAMVRVYPVSNKPLVDGNAVVALNDSCSSGGISLNGGPTIHVVDGGVFSYSCIEGCDGITVDNAGVSAVGAINGICHTANNATLVKQNTVAPPKPVIPMPDCSSFTVNLGDITDGQYSPGKYSNIKVNGGKTADLKPGLYCITGEVTVNGGGKFRSVGTDGSFILDTSATGDGIIQHGAGITMFMMNDSWKLTGNGIFQIQAPLTEQVAGAGQPIQGIAVIAPWTNTQTFKMLGTGDSWITGTVFTPSSQLQVGGTHFGALTPKTQYIGDNVWLHGTGDIYATFVGNVTYHDVVPSTLDMQR